MWKFAASKFKNASPKTIKKEECITGLPPGDLPQTNSSLVAASSTHVTFNTSSTAGGSVGILPLGTIGRVESTLPLLHAHSGAVTDIAFSPFNDQIFATGSEDTTVKLWRLPDTIDSCTVSSMSANLTIQANTHRVERVIWHPTVDHLITVASRSDVKLYDVQKSNESFLALDGHSDQVQSLSWSQDGRHLYTTCRDKKMRMFDPRAKCSPIQEVKGHQHVKESWVTSLSDENYCLTTGFNMMREREVTIRDVRKSCSSVKTESTGTSSGAFIPLYDPDSNMLFLVGKGDTCVRFWEVTYKAPFITEASMFQLDQIYGAALVPKRAMDVMKCEVNRLMVLSQNVLIPLSYYVPRKSYTEYHADLYPDTNSMESASDIDEWISGSDRLVSKISMDPSKQSTPIAPKPKVPSSSIPTTSTPTQTVTNTVPMSKQSPRTVSKPTIPPSKPVIAQKPVVNVLAGVRQCKFRHLKGDVITSKQITNLKHLNQSLPWESDMFATNTTFCAVPLAGSAGLIAVFVLAQPGRLPDSGLPAVQNGSVVADFVWDPFDEHKLAVGCDDAKIKVWTIPKDGIEGILEEPCKVLKGHTEKLYLIRYNPVVQGVLASASYDMSVRIWSVEDEEQLYQLHGHTDTIFCLSWDTTGQKCATACKDQKIRVYDVQKQSDPVLTGIGPAGSRGARIVWTLNNQYLFVSGFDKQSSRIASVYIIADLTLLHSLSLNMGTAVLVPHYDEDSNTILLTGRGESMVYCYEIGTDSTYLFELSHYVTGNQYQAFTYFTKNILDVKSVEFLRALRLTTHAVETVSFTVPRLKVQYFQDDIFPDTRKTWQPQINCTDWMLSGETGNPEYLNLCPNDMKPLSQAPKELPRASKYNYTEEVVNHKTEEDIKDDMLRNLSDKMNIKDMSLPQDEFEGCDDDEWDD